MEGVTYFPFLFFFSFFLFFCYRGNRLCYSEKDRGEKKKNRIQGEGRKRGSPKTGVLNGTHRWHEVILGRIIHTGHSVDRIFFYLRPPLLRFFFFFFFFLFIFLPFLSSNFFLLPRKSQPRRRGTRTRQRETDTRRRDIARLREEGKNDRTQKESESLRKKKEKKKKKKNERRPQGD